LTISPASQRTCERLGAELDEVKRTARRERDSAVAAARAELTERRTKQYTTLNRLMEEDDARAQLASEKEALEERVAVQTAQIAAATERLLEKQAWRETDARASLARMEEAQTSIASVAQQLTAKEAEVDALRVQLHDCTVTMTKMVERQGALERRLATSLSSDEASKAKGAEVEAQVEGLEAEVLRQGRARMAAVQVRNTLEAQLKEAIASGVDLRARVTAREVSASAGTRAGEKRHAAVERARARLWTLLLQHVTQSAPVGSAAAVAAASACSAGASAATRSEAPLRFDASNCELGDADVALLLRRLRRGGAARDVAIGHLNLAGNRITDASAPAIAALVASAVGVRRLDLSGNALSAAGVRRIAEALRANAARLGAQHVYVQPGGSIEAVGAVGVAPVAGDEGGTLTTAAMTRQRKNAVLAAAEIAAVSALQKVSTVATIDVTGNAPRRGGPAVDARGAAAKQQKPFLPRLGGGGAGSASPSAAAAKTKASPKPLRRARAGAKSAMPHGATRAGGAKARVR
jgi:hypothetical protein